MTAAQTAENHGDDARPHIYKEGCMHLFQPGPTHKIPQNYQVERYSSMEHISND